MDITTAKNVARVAKELVEAGCHKEAKQLLATFKQADGLSVKDSSVFHLCEMVGEAGKAQDKKKVMQYAKELFNTLNR